MYDLFPPLIQFVMEFSCSSVKATIHLGKGYYEDINGVQGASACYKTKVAKCKFEDQEGTWTTPDKDTAACAAADEDPGH